MYGSSWRGSSPRMWGTVGTPYESFGFTRFIPTHVGNSSRPCATRCPSAVHPHACGEQTNGQLRILRARGSSPRMWGTGKRLRGL